MFFRKLAESLESGSTEKGISRKIVLGGVALLVVGVIACDRSDRDYAAASSQKVSSHPTYSISADDESVRKETFVAAVLPQGEPVIDGQALFAANCSACHQITGSGVPGVFPPLNKSPYVTGDNLDRLASIILYGLQGPIKVLGTDYNNVMAGLGGALKDDQIAAIMNYVRGAWDNKDSKGGEASKELVAKMRQKWGARGAFNITELGAAE